MVKGLWLVLSLGFLPWSLLGQEKSLVISGEAYTQLSVKDVGTGWWQTSQAAGFSFSLNNDRHFEAFIDGVYYLNTPEENTLDSVARSFTIRVFPLENLTITAGKQRLKWGTAKAFSPLDKLEARGNLLETHSFLPGIPGIRTDLLFDEFWSLTALVIPETDVRFTRGALRLEGNWENLDISLGGLKYNYVDWADDLSSQTLDRGAVFGDLAYFIGSLGLYAEAQIRFGNESTYFFPGMLGVKHHGDVSQPVLRGAGGMTWAADIGLSRQIGLFAEYFFNSEGWSSNEASEFQTRFSGWKIVGGPAVAPETLGNLGAFRHHYSVIGFNNLAITREIQAAWTALTEWESGFWTIQSSLNFEFSQDLGVAAAYTFRHKFFESEPGSDLFLIGNHALVITFSGVF